MSYINNDFEAKFDALTAKEFDQQLRYAAAGGRAEFTIPVLCRMVGTDDLALCGAQKVEINPTRAEAFQGSRMHDAFGFVAPGGQAVAVRQKILAGEEISIKDMREVFPAGAPVLISHSAASALAIHHATGAPVLCALTPDNFLPASAYAMAVSGNHGERVVIVPDGSGQSNAAALHAARASGCKVADVAPHPAQRIAGDIMQGLIDVSRIADAQDRLLPSESARRDLRAAMIHDFLRDRIFEPIAAAQCITPLPKNSRDRSIFVKRRCAPSETTSSGKPFAVSTP